MYHLVINAATTSTSANGWLTNMKVDIYNQPTVLPPKITCKAIEISDMKFGTLSDSIPTARSSLQISCSASTSISLQVNNGIEFNDEPSGTTIRFDSPNNTVCKPDCNVILTGTMTRDPNFPGYYKWSIPIPITMNYD
ncbi:hypothetical protein [Vibrio cholerae]|uniref:hypothetical protein n=1 Tax=Vibrio cholerae TaxID=666 RepID=UPI0012B56736|nr:hypothetical protein [Vibrio cholerae]